MKIALGSDLHLEFGKLKVDNPESADVLVLAGDITVIREFGITEELNTDTECSKIFHEFFSECSKKFKHVLYVMGNHEYYSIDIDIGVDTLRKYLKMYSNVMILDNDSVNIDGINFHGTTLWTDMNNKNPIDMIALQSGMTDFVRIYNGWTKFTPEDAANKHAENLEFLINSVDSTQENVIITHHAPSYLSIDQDYAGSRLNAGYASNLELLIEQLKPKLWFHGHTHCNKDYMVYNTRVACNPRGYIGYESLANRFKFKIFDI